MVMEQHARGKIHSHVSLFSFSLIGSRLGYGCRRPSARGAMKEADRLVCRRGWSVPLSMPPDLRGVCKLFRWLFLYVSY